jgi:hypothetical protein
VVSRRGVEDAGGEGRAGSDRCVGGAEAAFQLSSGRLAGFMGGTVCRPPCGKL